MQKSAIKQTLKDLHLKLFQKLRLSYFSNQIKCIFTTTDMQLLHTYIYICHGSLALFDISIWHIDCRYIDTFENIDKYWIDSKLAYRTGLGLRHNQRACPIGHQLLSRGAQMCNFGNSSSGWFEMQKSLMFCRLYWQRTRLAPVLIILWFDTLHNGSVVN